MRVRVSEKKLGKQSERMCERDVRAETERLRQELKRDDDSRHQKREREREKKYIYIYIRPYMPLDRFAAYIFAVFWFGSLSQIFCVLRELRWSFCLVLVLSHHPQSFPSSQCLLLLLIVCSGCRFQMHIRF